MLQSRLFVCLVACLLLELTVVTGLNVYLTSLTVDKQQRVSVLEGDLQVYFQCTGADKLRLPQVTALGQQYTWLSEDLLITTITQAACKTCAFYEDRTLIFKQDDLIGEAFQLCQADFASQQGVFEITQTDAFSGSFGCQQCVPPAPVPPTAAPVQQAPAQLPVQPKQSRPAGLPVGALVGIAIAICVVSFAAGFAALLFIRMYRTQQELRKQLEFDAALRDPALGLDDVCQEDERMMHDLTHPNKYVRLHDRTEI
jgi:hypothetical protein